MDATDLARWQFAITTVYHFLFVPITIGMSLIVAVFHTAWVRTHNPQWMRLAKFFGKLFLINFALGLVTGIVQEFQFGMNWSDYSRFVGDIFGAPLAIEALLAFFLESTFLGLWIFGWGRLPEKLHATTIWLVAHRHGAVGVLHPRRQLLHAAPGRLHVQPASGRAELTDFFAVLTNKVQLVTFPHVIFSAYMAGAGVVMGVALWLMRREAKRAADDAQDVAAPTRRCTAGRPASARSSRSSRPSASPSPATSQGKIMTEVQPMKMAAAEALYESVPAGVGAPFSVLTVGSLDGSHANAIIEIPGLLSFLATGDFKGAVKGINDLKAEYAQTYGASGNPRVADIATASSPTSRPPTGRSVS